VACPRRSAGLRDAGGEHLQRNRRQQGLEKCCHRWYFDQVIGVRPDGVVAFLCEDDGIAPRA